MLPYAIICPLVVLAIANLCDASFAGSPYFVESLSVADLAATLVRDDNTTTCTANSCVFK